MKLLLRKDIPKLGLCGDVVDVSAGYARNYLLPHHLGIPPTAANLKKIVVEKNIAAELRAHSKRLTGLPSGRVYSMANDKGFFSLDRKYPSGPERTVLATVCPVEGPLLWLSFT